MEKTVGRIGILNSDLYSDQFFFQCRVYLEPVEEPGELCTVVFALIVTGPSKVCGGDVLLQPHPLPTIRFDKNYAKTTVHCSPDSSMPRTFGDEVYIISKVNSARK
jgi:hypothetical protein